MPYTKISTSDNVHAHNVTADETFSSDATLLSSDGLGNLTGTSFIGKVTPSQIAGGVSATAPALAASAGTIATSSLISRVSANSAGSTGAIMAVGTVNGQWCVVVNEQTNASGDITFAALATSNVYQNATPTSVLVKAGTAALFVWDTGINTTGAWVKVAPFAG